jgi:hypothetical protein
MTDSEIVEYLKSGGVGNFGATSRNQSIMALMASLERDGLVTITDVSTRQETRFEVQWKAQS